MKSVLITGANKGIGFETARQLLKEGLYVYLGSRNIENGLKAVEKLKVEGFNQVEFIHIDITDEASIASARTTIEEKAGSLDVLINNAGIAGAFAQTALTTDTDNFKRVFDTNLYGTARVIQAFMDILKKSPEPQLINVSSSVGSLSLHNDPEWQYYDDANSFAVYSSSKAALNMYTITLAYELRDSNVKITMVDPGYTKTDFNGHQGTGTVEDAATRVVNALLHNQRPSGSFISEETNPETGEISW